MTKNFVYGIFDEALETYIVPLHFVNDKLAVRSMTSAFKSKALKVPDLYDYPNNFQLRKLAKFDDVTGKYETLPVETVLYFDTIDNHS